jgi:hypothetical protein
MRAETAHVHAMLHGTVHVLPAHLLMPWSGTASGWCSSTKRNTAACSRAATASSSFWCITVSSCCLADRSNCTNSRQHTADSTSMGVQARQVCQAHDCSSWGICWLATAACARGSCASDNPFHADHQQHMVSKAGMSACMPCCMIPLLPDCTCLRPLLHRCLAAHASLFARLPGCHPCCLPCCIVASRAASLAACLPVCLPACMSSLPPACLPACLLRVPNSFAALLQCCLPAPSSTHLPLLLHLARIHPSNCC